MATRTKKAPAKKTKKVSAKRPAAVKPAAAKAKITEKKTVKAEKKSAVKTEAKVVSTESKKPSLKKEISALERLRGLHISSVLAYIVFGVISFIFMKDAAKEVLLNTQARDTFVQSKDVVLGNASEVLFSMEFRYVLLASLLVAALGSLLAATRLRKTYEKGVTSAVSGWRWLFYGVSAALLVELVSFMAGVQDLMTLKVVAGLVIAGSLFAWFSERENMVPGVKRTLGYYGAMFAFIVALLPLAGSVVGTTLFNDERFGWHIYALSAALLVGLVGTLWNLKSFINKRTKFEYVVFEQRYLRIDQITKFLVVIILASAVK